MKMLATAFLLFATTAVTIDTSELAPGKSQVWIQGDRRVYVERMGDGTQIRIEEEGGHVGIVDLRSIKGKRFTFYRDNGKPRTAPPPDRRPILVDGLDLDAVIAGSVPGVLPSDVTMLPQDPRRNMSGPRFYVCPKDEALLRVPHVEPGKVFFCPVDGTEMKAGSGPDRQVFLLQ